MYMENVSKKERKHILEKMDPTGDADHYFYLVSPYYGTIVVIIFVDFCDNFDIFHMYIVMKTPPFLKHAQKPCTMEHAR